MSGPLFTALSATATSADYKQYNCTERRKSLSSAFRVIEYSSDLLYNATMENVNEKPASRSRSGSKEIPTSFTIKQVDDTFTEPTTSTSDFQRLENAMTDITAKEFERSNSSTALRRKEHTLEQTRRLVQKGGDCNVISVNVTKRGRRYLADGFTTLVELRWRYQILLYAIQFVVSWTAFALVYYALAVVKGDIGHYSNTGQLINRTWTPCVNNVYDYTSALLYSLETQTTIGYGIRVINPSCRFGVFVLMLQTCIGTFIQTLATGVVFAKISRPKGRARTLLFSRSAVICQRDGNYQLLFRVADMRIKSHIIGTSLRALMVRNRLTKEGEQIPLCQYPLELDTETSPANDNFVFMIWPVTVVHHINESSPFWEMSANDCSTNHYEIVVILEGIVESTGSSTQFRTSYVPQEIRWGERLAPLVTFQKENGCYLIDYGQFHHTIPVWMPEYSAHDWALLRAANDQSNVHITEEDYPIEFMSKSLQDRAKARYRHHTGLLHGRSKSKRKLPITGATTTPSKNPRFGKILKTPAASSSCQELTWTISDSAVSVGNMSRQRILTYPVMNNSVCSDSDDNNINSAALFPDRKSTSSSSRHRPSDFFTAKAFEFSADVSVDCSGSSLFVCNDTSNAIRQ